MRRDIYQGTCLTVLGSDFGNWVMNTKLNYRGVTLSWGDSKKTPVTSAVSHLNFEQLVKGKKNVLKWNEKSLFPTKSPDWWPLLHVLFILKRGRTSQAQDSYRGRAAHLPNLCQSGGGSKVHVNILKLLSCTHTKETYEMSNQETFPANGWVSLDPRMSRY